MNLNGYQEKAMAFRLPSADELYALLNLTGEVGELNSLNAKVIRDQHLSEEEYQRLAKKELGDILWCLAAVTADFGFTLEEIAQGNLDKLTERSAKGTLQGSGDDR